MSELITLFPPAAEYHVLEAGHDGIDQMLGFLVGEQDLDSLHIISHGSSGSLELGSTVLDASSLAYYADTLAQIGASVREGGDILLYGCDVGRGEEGRLFLEALAYVTGADVAASDDMTGSTAYGGDWVLETTAGVVDCDAAFSAESYRFLLSSDTEFLVNTCTDAVQAYPAAAMLGEGGFVLVWASYGQDGSQNGIFAQRYDAGGRAGSEFQVNTYTSAQQLDPAVASLPGGGFVVAWQSQYQDGDGYGVFARLYDSEGIAADSEFQVNTVTDSSQGSPSVAALSGGGFVVAWQSDGQDGDGEGIYAQRYDSKGIAAGGEFRVNTETASAQELPSVAALSGGGFVVVWESDGQDGSNKGVFAQRYGADGSEAGDEFQVNTNPKWTQAAPSLAALADGGFVAAWESSGQDGDGFGIYAQRFDASGAKVGDEFRVNTVVANDQINAAVSALDDGGFVVAWQSNDQDGSDWGIYAQRYDASGSPVYAANSEPEGGVSIEGVARSGETLQADTSNLSDADGLGAFSYQWYADGTAISGATSSALVLTDDEIGKVVTVDVGYDDGNGAAELVSSSATGPVVFSVLELRSSRTASGLDVEVWLKEGCSIDSIDLEFSYDGDEATYTGYSSSMDGWEVIAAEPAVGLIAVGGYSGDLSPTGGGSEVRLGTLSFSFAAEEPDFALSLTDYSQLCDSGADPCVIELGRLPELNAPRLEGGIVDQEVDEDASYSYALSGTLFSDPDTGDGDRLSFSATLADGTELPSWLEFDPDTMMFEGVPLNDDVGTLDIIVSATDRGGLSKTAGYRLTVANVNDVPVVAAPIEDQVTDEQVAYSFSLPAGSFADPDAGDVLSYSAAIDGQSSLPAWLSFDPSTLTFSGTPGREEIGEVSIRVEAVDQSGEVASDTFTLAVELVNNSPVGRPVIDGSPVQGELLTADTDGISDIDGLGVFSYQWYADGEAIAGATEGSYTLSALERFKVVTVSVGYTDQYGTAELVDSQPTERVGWPVSELAGEVLFWKTGAAIEGAEVTIAGGLDESGADVYFEDLVAHEDGSRSVDVWIRTTDSVENVELGFVLQAGTEAEWSDDPSLPADWTASADSSGGDLFVLAGSASGGLPAGSLRLGTLTVSAAADPDLFELSLTGGALGEVQLSQQSVFFSRTTVQADGSYGFSRVVDGGYAMRAENAAGDDAAGAVKASDALAALKLAVGLNPNAEGAAVSNCQYLAADVNRDGTVRASDALAILKMAVQHESAPEQEWIIVSDGIEEAGLDRKSVDWSAADIDLSITADTEVGLVGVLRGDVNGSWEAVVA